MPAVVHPRCVGDPELSQHLGGEVEQGERLVVALDAQLGPVAHRLLIPQDFAFCAEPRLEPRSMIEAETMLDRIAAADTLNDLEALRVSALGKAGSITALLKSLGSMDTETRTAEAPKIHALREAVTGAIADRKAAL